MRKILFFMVLSISFLFSINVQTASKDELMCIKGIGDKKAAAIIKYRKSHKLKSADDLINIKGFGKGIIKNVKKEIKSASCGGKKSTKKSSAKKKSSSSKSETKKSDKKKSSKKKSDKKKDSEESDSKKAA